MLQNELITRSPIRILEQSTHGGVGTGNIGVIAGRKGIGKTACLVHIATDQLLQGKQVIHVSFSTDSTHIISWYEDIFHELASRYDLENSFDVHDKIVRKRIIMNFTQDGIHLDSIEKSIRRLIEAGNFSAAVLIVDGYDFSAGSLEELRSLRRFAHELNLTLWFSASVKDNHHRFEGVSVPPLLAGLISEIAVVICMEPKENFIKLNLVKDHNSVRVADLHLRLDPKILLIAEEQE